MCIRDRIAAIKDAVTIPVFANGDIDSPQKAKQVLAITGADGLMIGRAAQGQPWIFRDIAAFLESGVLLQPPAPAEVRAIMSSHLRNLYTFHGEFTGVRIARKHIGWYASGRALEQTFRQTVMRAETAEAQMRAVEIYFDALDKAA